MIIKDFVMIFAFVSVIVNMTEGRLKEYGAKKKYFETPFGKKLMKNFLANGEGKEGVPDGKYAHMLGMVLKRTRRGKRGNILFILWNKFQPRSRYSNYNTRFCENLQIPKYNLEYSTKRFSYTALKAWNEIPMNIRELPTFYQYKKQLKSHLMS